MGPAAAEAEADLIRVVEDENEHEMVRHEAAEALGSLDSTKSVEVLKKYVHSPCRIVRERYEIYFQS